MKRRTFLEGAGTAVGGAIALDLGVRRVRASETITVAVYQTDRLTERFRKAGRYGDAGQRLTGEAVSDVLDPHFTSSFELEYETLTVPHRVAALPPTLSTFGEESRAAGRSLVNWTAHNRQRSSVDSHILLSYHAAIGTGNGIASPGILPTCCGPIDRYGIAWMAAERSALSAAGVRETIAHEIGHTIGLHHSHGTNVGGGRSLMLTNSYAQRVGRNRFGERVRPGGDRVAALNDEITERHLRV